MLRNKGLKQKMLAFSIGVSVALLAVGGIGFIALQKVSSRYNALLQFSLQTQTAINEMTRAAGAVGLANALMGVPGNSPDEVNLFNQMLDENVSKYEAAEKALIDAHIPIGEKHDDPALAEKWKALLSVNNGLASLSFSTLKADREKYLALLKGDFAKARAAYDEQAGKSLKEQQEETQGWVEAAIRQARWARGIAVGFVLVGFAFAMGTGYFFSRNLSRVLQEIAQGLSGGADEVASASHKISTSAEELSSSSTEQAAAIEETAASIEEMSSMVARNADNANRSRNVASTSRETAVKGKQVVEQMIVSIREINDSNTEILRQIEGSNRQIGEIVTVISEIGAKTKVINDIVFQTKLLSFNASVEAARAGEHGKGFAVVAEEVGNLAQMSGNASKEISQMLDGSIRRVEGIVTNTRTQVERLVAVGQQKVQAGTEVAKRCGEALDEIVKNVSDVNMMVGEISAASTDQAQGVQAISKAMTQLDLVTQQNASASQQSASAATQLSAQVERLRSMAKDLVQTVQGGEGTRTASATTVAGSVYSFMKSGFKAAKRSDPKPAQPGASNVVRIDSAKPKTTAPALVSPEQAQGRFKKAVGADAVPSEDDPRFNDV